MRILWLSNKLLTGVDSGSTGTWLDATAQELASINDLELANVAERKGARFERCDLGGIKQWAIPFTPQSRLNQGHPPAEIVQGIRDIVDDYAPDVIHVWGTEGFWGLITSELSTTVPCLLTIQGIKSAIAKYYSGGLSWIEQVRCIGLKEIVRTKTISAQQKEFRRWSQVEQKIVRQHKHFQLHSAWQEAHIRQTNPAAAIYYSDLLLRQEFYEAEPWMPNSSQVLFCSVAYPAPFKGLHVAIRAYATLKKRYPKSCLKIAGIDLRNGIRQDGYVAWLLKEIRRLGVDTSVQWLGPLSAKEMTANLQKSAVFILPSFIESYPVTLREALTLGVPTVASFAGGIPTLAKHEQSSLLFSPGDDVMCAHHVERLITEPQLARSISSAARVAGNEHNAPQSIIDRQLHIYRDVLSLS